MTDDDKEGAEPGPWDGLDAEGPSGGDDAAFIFDMLGDGSGDASPPDVEPQPPEGDQGDAGDDGGDDAAGVPLAVFPPPEADLMQTDDEPARDVQGHAAADHGPADGDDPEIFSWNDSANDAASPAGHLDAWPDPADGASAANGVDAADAARDRGFGPAEDGDESSIDPPADEVSFTTDAFPAGDASPFADSGQADPFAPRQDSSAAESAAELASIPIAAAATAAASPRKKKSAIGQMIGVALGGLAAIPITGLIILGLMWGLQLDQLKGLAKLYPSAVLPEKFRPGAAKPAPVVRAPSLDDLPTAAADQPPGTAPADTVAAAPTDGDEPTPPAAPAAKGDEEMADDDVAAMKKKGDEEDEAAAAKTFTLPPDVPAELAQEFRAALAKLGTAEDIQAALTRLNAAEPAPPVAMPAELQPPPPPPPAAAEPAEVALDLTGLESAVEQAAEALDALERVADRDAPDRKRLMVGWYRRLASLGEQFSLVESAAVNAGHPLEQPPEAVDGLLERIRGSEPAVDDVRTLGRMWLGAQKRRADGTVLVATVESSRQSGPYWITRVNLAGSDGMAREVAVISRMRPEVDIGDEIMITGVLFDADTVWAADVRPLVDRPAVDADVPAIGVPPVFDAPQTSAPMSKPPAEPSAEPPSRKDGVGQAGEQEPPAAKPPAAKGEPAGDKPAGDGDKPVGDGDKPAGDGFKPAGDGGKPAGDGGKPAASKPDDSKPDDSDSADAQPPAADA